jgi:hypothetical protein
VSGFGHYNRPQILAETKVNMTPIIGFILVTYKKPEQIIRLVRTLNRMFDHPPIACHHDFSQTTLPMEALGKNVSFVYPHLQTGWGDFSTVEATLRAMQLMYGTCNSPDWFVLLSEADYPIKPATQILKDLTLSPYDVHIDHWQIRHNDDMWHALRHERYCTFKFRIPFFDEKLRLTKREVTLRHPLITFPFLPFYQNFQCYAGEHWFCANRKAAEYVIEFHSARPALANHYRRAESFFIVCPGESYFHTILCNAPHLRVSDNHWRYIDWSTKGPHPKTLVSEDLPRIQASSAHFARKFDFDEDVNVLDKLDACVENIPD